MAANVKMPVEKAPRAVGNLLMTLMFASLGVIDLLTRDYLGGAIWLGLAAAMSAMGPESTPWREIPLWRRLLGSALVGVSLALFGYQTVLDFSA